MPGPLSHLLITSELISLGQADNIERLDEKCRAGKWPVHDLASRRANHANHLEVVSLLRLVDQAHVTAEELGDWLRERRAKHLAEVGGTP